MLLLSRPVSMRGEACADLGAACPSRPMVGTAVGRRRPRSSRLAWYAPPRRGSSGPTHRPPDVERGKRDIARSDGLPARSLIGAVQKGRAREPGFSRRVGGLPRRLWTSGHGTPGTHARQPRGRPTNGIRPRSVTVEMVCTPGNPVRPCAAAPRRRGAVRVSVAGRDSAAQDRLADRQALLRAELHCGRTVPQPVGNAGRLAGGVGRRSGRRGSRPRVRGGRPPGR